MASLRMCGLIELARRIQFNDSGGVKLLTAVATPPPVVPNKTDAADPSQWIESGPPDAIAQRSVFSRWYGR